MNLQLGQNESQNMANSDVANGSDIALLPRIHEALKIVHDPYSNNESRRQASQFLEELKADQAAPYHGFRLAADRSHQAEVRHYALSLLEHAIKHKWAVYTEDQATALRQWVMQLAETLSPEDPLFLRNKIVQLWTELAKRCWGEQWLDMDELLVQRWLRGPLVDKEFVFFVLETLSEEIFNGEDTTAALREGTLSKACVEIFTPALVLAEAFPNRQKSLGVRYGEEGWLVRLGELFARCLENGLCNEESRTCAVRILAVYKSVMPWAIPTAISAASCVEYMGSGLAASTVAVQMASVEALYALYSRSQFSPDEFLSLVCPMYRRETVELLRKLFEWSIVDVHDIDEEKYLFSKKFSEMMSNLGNFIIAKLSALPEYCDLPNLLNLFFAIVRSPSFVVSIPVLVNWTLFLRSEAIGGSLAMDALISPLLEVCASRLIRYESLPEDADDPSLIFLLEDIDTVPERHAFLGNYRRYCIQVIEQIVRRKQSVAIYHILNQINVSMQHLYDGQSPFTFENYSKTSMPILRVDAHFTVIEAALKGYMKWRTGNDQEGEEQRVRMECDLEAWCEQLLDMNVEDPLIRKRILHLAVAFSISVLHQKLGFMLKVLERIIMTRPAERPEYPAYTDAVKELQSDCIHELQRLALKVPDQLMDVYDHLEARIKEIIAAGGLDSKTQTGYETFLFTIIHRTTRIERQIQYRRLEGFIQPVQASWQNPDLPRTLTSFDSFCELLGFGQVRAYLISRKVHEVQDWASYQLDAEGQALQVELNERVKGLPLRATRAFLTCSTDRMDKIGVELVCALWHDTIPIMLPHLLDFLTYAHAFHDPTSWLGLPTEMRSVVDRILTDRFWQAGISEGSKEEFYARVSGTRSTMEGFASSIRGAVRTVRETCYTILFCLCRLGINFYGFRELPGPLAKALFAEAHCLSSHQWIHLLNVARPLVDACPPPLRSHFLPPILATCFAQMDRKVSSEWERLLHKQSAASDEDNLAQEMKEESILRQLTYNIVMMVATLLDPARQREQSGVPQHHTLTNGIPDAPLAPAAGQHISSQEEEEPRDNGNEGHASMRSFCLSSTVVLEQLLLFCSHAIGMRDTRCCAVVLRVLRSIVPEFSVGHECGSSEEVSHGIREFISSDVLKACITSLHEPYFVDLQKDLAQLIATIIVHYAGFTNTPRQVLLSLPVLSEGAIKQTIELLSVAGVSARQQRALVLELLKDLKGVSISEQGRIMKSASAVRKERSMMQEEFMKLDERAAVKRGGTPDFEGVAAMLT